MGVVTTLKEVVWEYRDLDMYQSVVPCNLCATITTSAYVSHFRLLMAVFVTIPSGVFTTAIWSVLSVQYRIKPVL